MVRKKLNLYVKSVVWKENVKTVLMSAYNVNMLHMNNALIILNKQFLRLLGKW